MRKFFAIAIHVAVLIAATCLLSSTTVLAADFSASDVDEITLAKGLDLAASNCMSRVDIEIERPYAQDDDLLAIQTVAALQDLWAYQRPEVFNYTRAGLVGCTVNPDGLSFTVTLYMEAEDGGELADAYAQKQAAELMAEKVYNQLLADGLFNADSSETEIARVLLDWVVANVEYVQDYTNACHTAYSAFFNHYAVCDGYTSAYNLLLKQAGIACRGVKGDAGGLHEWTQATLDGRTVYIDATWCDANPDGVTPDPTYFAVEPASLTSHHAF